MTGLCFTAHDYWWGEVERSNKTSFWAKGLVLLHCSAAWLEFWTFSLILCQWIQGPEGTWDVFLRGFFPQQQLFWNEADVNNYWAKRSWWGGNRGGLAEFHLQSYGINWHTSKSRDAFLNKKERTPFTCLLQLCNPQILALCEQHCCALRPSSETSQNQRFLVTWGIVSIKAEKNWGLQLRMSRTENLAFVEKHRRTGLMISQLHPRVNPSSVFQLDERDSKNTVLRWGQREKKHEKWKGRHVKGEERKKVRRKGKEEGGKERNLWKSYLRWYKNTLKYPWIWISHSVMPIIHNTLLIQQYTFGICANLKVR